MFSYDLVRYESQPLAQAHPDRLGTLGFLHGLATAPAHRCRYLELGCGDGAQILPLALMLPASRFAGIDLSSAAIGDARRAASALGITNASFERRDILDLTPGFGEFDYIVAHGVYSWVPDAVRDRMLAICRENLAPGGVAYVSYNAYPGGHQREMLRRMLQYATAGIDDPETTAKHGFALLNLLERSDSAVLKQEVARTKERPWWQLYHDDLEPEDRFFYFHEFIGHACRHGLQFLAEAQFPIMQLSALPQDVADAIRAAAGGDIVREQQYLDFFELRRFRQTLLCRVGARVTRPIDPARISALYASTTAVQVAADEFQGTKGARMKTSLEFALAAMACLSERRPAPVAFDELLGACGADRGALAQFLLAAYSSGLIELHMTPPRFALPAGDRPRTFALARCQAAEGAALVTTMRLASIQLEDEQARRLLLLLDGTRDRAALAAELDATAEELDAKLDQVARLALLEA